MSVKIYYLTNTYNEVSNVVVNMANTSGMTISHFAGVTKSTMATLPFVIEGVETHIPTISEPEFCLVIRKKVDLTAVGVNGNVIKDIGKDIGKYDYKDSVPTVPNDLPPGFTELYKG